MTAKEDAAWLGVTPTVPMTLHKFVADIVGEAKAHTLLWGCDLIGDKLASHTVEGYYAVRRHPEVMALLNEKKIIPEKRQFPGHPERKSLAEAHPNLFGEPDKPRRGRRPEAW